jgi:hypothetical protein
MQTNYLIKMLLKFEIQGFLFFIDFDRKWPKLWEKDDLRPREQLGLDAPVLTHTLPFFLKMPDIIFSVMQKPFINCVIRQRVGRFLHSRKKLISRRASCI